MTEYDMWMALLTRMMSIRERMTPPQFPFDRNGLRLTIAAIEDETGELYDEWRDHKRHLGNAIDEIRHELLDIAGIAMVAYENTFKPPREYTE